VPLGRLDLDFLLADLALFEVIDGAELMRLLSLEKVFRYLVTHEAVGVINAKRGKRSSELDRVATLYYIIVASVAFKVLVVLILSEGVLALNEEEICLLEVVGLYRFTYATFSAAILV
jgi:hypothetical protein